MKRCFVFLLLPALGCATSSDGVDLAGIPETRTVTAGAVSPGGGQMGMGSLSVRYVEEPVLVEAPLDASEEEVWPLLLDAFRAEGLVPDGLEPAARVISVGRIEWSGERLGTPLSVYLDCGISATGLSLADEARVVAAVTARVGGRDAANSRITVRMDAVAFPLAESGERARACTTTRALETSIIGRVERALQPEPAQAGPRAEGGPSEVSVAVHPSDYADLPFGPGDKIRVWVSSSERLTGAFLGFQADSLLLKRSRRTTVPVGTIQLVQAKRTRRRPILIGSLLGMAAGVTVATMTDVGIGGRHAIQGEILNPGLGVVVGGLVGALTGSVFFGTSWVDVPRFW
jgi:hypothetical protein